MRGGAMVNEVVVAVPRLVSARGDLHHALRPYVTSCVPTHTNANAEGNAPPA
jgi:hypothetical protein